MQCDHCIPAHAEKSLGMRCTIQIMPYLAPNIPQALTNPAELDEAGHHISKAVTAQSE